MKKSKNVKHGTLVRFHGDKLIVASKNTKLIAGIWNEKHQNQYLTDNGMKIIELPEGLQLSGQFICKLKEEE